MCAYRDHRERLYGLLLPQWLLKASFFLIFFSILLSLTSQALVITQANPPRVPYLGLCAIASAYFGGMAEPQSER